ncbi:MAG: hypothetical protein ACP5M0_05510 [Desulfomonilaceae bacterium]
MKALVCLCILVFPVLALCDDEYVTFYDARGAITHTWTRYNNSDTTVVRDNANRITGYRQRFGNRIEIRDNANRIIGYEDVE